MAFRTAVKVLDQDYKVGDVIKIQAFALHPTETGFAMDKESRQIRPRFFVKQMKVSFEGATVAIFDIEVSASNNPKIIFPFKVSKPGAMNVSFEDNMGDKEEKTVKIL